MAGIINRLPNGLLGYLGLKTLGANPRTLGDVVAPTWDLSELYLADGAKHESATGVIGTGTNIAHTAPNGFVWVVHAWGVQCDSAALEAIGCAYLVFVPPNSTPVVPMTNNSSMGASASIALAYATRPIILNPGESLGLQANQVTGAPTLYSALRYTELPV